jgi:hypothetical protein
VISPSSVVACVDAERLLERSHDALCSDERAREVGADLDHVPPDGLEMEHVVERRDRLAVGRRQVENLRDLLQRLRREPPALLLRESKRRERQRPAVRVAMRDRLDLRRQVAWAGWCHRSTSPITVSDPTIAIMSATSDSCTQVAVAWSATNDGARN